MNDNNQDNTPLPPPPSSSNTDPVVAKTSSASIIEQLANLADKSEVMSLLEFKEEQHLDKNDPLWAFLLQFKTIENSVNKQEQILNLLIDDFEAKFEQQIDANQQRLETSFRTYSKDLINQYQSLTDNLQTVEEASLNLTQAKISGSVAKLVRHAAHTKAVSDWLAMSRLGLYILIPMIFAGIGGWFARSYIDYRYSNSGLSSGRQPRNVTLDQIGFIKSQTVGSFIKANPQLKDKLIQDVPPLVDAIVLVYGDRSKALLKLPVRVLVERQHSYSELSLNKNIKKLAQTESPKFDVSEFEMGNLDLSEYSLEDVEGIGDSFVEDYEDWKDEYLGDIERLADISFDDFPNPIATTLAFISRVDTIWSDAHGQIKPGHSVSGSNQAGYAVPCQHSCAHIELDDIENSGRDIRWISEGRRWMLGKDPNNANICPEAPWGVDGGEGVLGILNCGKEPTGRNPYGPGFKVALWSVDETKDEAGTAIFFRICKRGIPDLGCTPYFIGPIPFPPANRENWIILGPGV